MSFIQVKKDLKIFVDDDFSAQDVSEEIIGRKGYSLFQLKDMDVPVPAFMAISSAIFTEYIADNLKTEDSSKLSIKNLNEKITNGSFSNKLKSDILTAYSRLSGFTDAWVAVRSSIVPPVNNKDLAFAGQLDTILNVKGLDELLIAIKKVYASAFTEKVATYLNSQGFSISDIKVAIVVQKMVQAEASGVVFTVDPISQNKDFLTVESVFGLGEVISSGNLTPDQYIVNKETLDFKEKRIVPQEWMIVRKIKHKKGESATQKVRISKSWQNQQKIDNRYLKELAEISVVIEKSLGKPQDIEWVLESSRLWILQTRSIEPLKIQPAIPEDMVQLDQKIIQSAQEIASREQSKQAVKDEIQQKGSSMSDTLNEESTMPLTAKPFTRQVIQAPTAAKHATKQKTPPVAQQVEGEQLLITGIGASSGTFRGSTVIVTDKSSIKKKSNLLNKKSIMVIPDHFPEMEKLVTRVGGIIADTGGLTSDIAIICREAGIPCIMGSVTATKMLQDNETLLIDGNVGAIYGKREKIQERKPAKPVKSVDEKPEQIMKEVTPTSKPLPAGIKDNKDSLHPEIKTATRIYTDLSNSFARGDKWKEHCSDSDGIAVIQIEDIYRKDNRHPDAYVQEGKTNSLVKILSSELSAVCDASAGNSVIASVGSMNVTQYRALTKGVMMERWNEESGISDSTAGLDRLLKKPKELATILKSIRRVRNVEGWRNISLSIEFPGPVKNITDFKKIVSSAGLRRSSTFKIYVTINTPAEAMMVEDFAKAGLDGVIVNVKNLSKLMMAQSFEDDSVLKTIENIRQGWKDGVIILQVPKDSHKLIKKCVLLGIHAISVSPGSVNQVRADIVKLEQEAVFS